MKLEVYNIKGKELGRKIDLDKSVFQIDPSHHAIYLDVKQHLANKRQGTNSTKQRSFIKGSTRKIKKQKGTGTARAGNIKNPIFRGGGRVFGPLPRDYKQKVNKKVKNLARKSALSIKAKENAIKVLDKFDLKKPQTKDFLKILKDFGFNDKKSLVVLGESNKNVYLSSRNLKNSKVVIVSELNTYSISNASNLIFDEKAVLGIVNVLKK
ncbi:MAG: 50S ribosomal protein L4 [Flavobacteriaceae bacterium]|nr:50S ribosomal protein L4 [Flavobacteriaceae bacterium]|tara:strand:+ start:19732 stop:20361 length:630 start_codon:yes stop_codon:yes gene_type:complete